MNDFHSSSVKQSCCNSYFGVCRPAILNEVTDTRKFLLNVCHWISRKYCLHAHEHNFGHINTKKNLCVLVVAYVCMFPICRISSTMHWKCFKNRLNSLYSLGSPEFKWLDTEENHRSRHSVCPVLGFFLKRNGPIGVSMHASKHYGKY
jgi:hypothetical protein